jgi:hypothetical protein
VIPFATWGTQKTTLAADTSNWDLVAQRANSSIKSVIVNSWRTAGDAQPRHKYLQGPMAGTGYNPATDTLEVQLSIGQYRFPTVPSRGIGELAYRLRKASSSELGPLAGTYSPLEWKHSQFQLAFDLERLARESGDTNSGLRSQGGSLLTLNVKGWGNDVQAQQAKELWLFIHHEAQLTLYGAGSDVSY